MLLQLFNRVDRGTACSQHRIYDKNISLFNIGRQLAIVFDRFKSSRVAVQTDMSDFGCRKQSLHAGDHAETGAEDRNNCQFLSCKAFRNCVAHRCLDRILLQLKISGSFIAFKRRNLAYQLSEILGTCINASDKSDFVLN